MTSYDRSFQRFTLDIHLNDVVSSCVKSIEIPQCYNPIILSLMNQKSYLRPMHPRPIRRVTCVVWKVHCIPQL